MNVLEGISKISCKQMSEWVEGDESGHIGIGNRAKFLDICLIGVLEEQTLEERKC